MNVIIPIPTTQTTLTSSNVAASSESDWNTGTTYSYGDVVIRDFGGIPYTFIWVYGGDRSGYDPIDYYITAINQYTTIPGEANYNKYWLIIGPTNRWAMFSGKGGTKTTNADSIVVSVTPGEFFNAVSFVNLDADTIQVTVTDPVEGLVYDSEEISLMDLTGITDHYRWYFYKISTKTLVNFAFVELPPYPNATIEVTILNSGDDVEIGEMVVGVSQYIGKMNYGSKLGCVDYSDTVQGAYYLQNDYEVSIPTSSVNQVKDLLSSLMGVAAVYVGVDDRPETVLYGYRSQFEINLQGPTMCDYTLQVKENK